MSTFKDEAEYRAHRDKVLASINQMYEDTDYKVTSLTCDDCRYRLTCPCSGDEYNTNGDCLAMK